MSVRVRMYVAMAFTVVLAYLYSRLSSDWSFGGFYAGLAGLITVIGLVALPWIDLAPDGALRRRASD
jgi:hypothetical protein